MKARVLALEKNPRSAELIRSYLPASDYQVSTVDPDELTPDVRVSDDYDAILFAEETCRLSVAQVSQILDLDRRGCFLVILGTAPTVNHAVDAMLDGAYAYLTKPVSRRRLQRVLAKGLKNQSTFQSIMEMAEEVQESNRQLQKHKRKLLQEKRQLEQRTRQLRFLHELSLAINASLDRDQVMKQVFLHLQEELQVQWCRARLFSRDDEIGWEHAVGSLAESAEIESLPLSVWGKAVGTMEVTMSAILSQEDRQLLDTVALQVAMALHNASNHDLVKRLAEHDSLTRLGNRRSFERQLDREFKRYLRYHENLSLILCDIDYFKDINDRYGHQSGDAVLRQLGRLMLKTFRECDYVARWGGDEFAVILPNTTEEQALLSAKRLQLRLKQPFAHNGFTIRVSASMGIADTKANSLTSVEELIALADEALYRGKKAGRNTIKLSRDCQQLPCRSPMEFAGLATAAKLAP